MQALATDSLPDLVLLDLKLPYLSGLEVLEWLRGQPLLKCVPVVMLTSSEQESDVETAYRMGAFGYLTKTTLPGLIGHARAIDEFWLKRNRVAPPGWCAVGAGTAAAI
jgi:CheY-like chemotaxis protein